MTLETHILDIIEGRKKAPLIKALLGLIAQGYRAGVAVRHFGYDWIIPSTKLKVPVISIGNIVAGGTGKTPFVIYLAKALHPKKIAIATKGYRRNCKKTVIVKKDTSPHMCGDEPFLLSQKLPEATVIVDESRAFAGYLAQIYGAEVLLLDDGMQHRQLHRDMEIVVMHSDDLFGKGNYLPAGLLRDSPRRLKRATHIILNGIHDEEHFAKVTELLASYTSAPITAMDIVIENKEEVAGKKVACFCGIASPSRFKSTLARLGCEIESSIEKPDHVAFTKEELETFCSKVKGADCLVCTEKDFVKLPKDLTLPLPIVAVRISHIPSFGKESLEKRIQEVKG